MVLTHTSALPGDTEPSHYPAEPVCLVHQFLAQQSIFLLVHSKQKVGLRRKELMQLCAGGQRHLWACLVEPRGSDSARCLAETVRAGSPTSLPKAPTSLPKAPSPFWPIGFITQRQKPSGARSSHQTPEGSCHFDTTNQENDSLHYTSPQKLAAVTVLQLDFNLPVELSSSAKN